MMRFSDDTDPVLVRWFFAAPGAKMFPGPSAFYSRVWEDRGDRYDDIGEQDSPRPWYSGLRPQLARGTGLCDPVGYFTFGLAPGQRLSRPVAIGPVPVCCLDAARPPLGCFGVDAVGGVIWTACGGAAGDGQVAWSKQVAWQLGGGGMGSGQSGWVVF
jgi:hypothetical protein